MGVFAIENQILVEGSETAAIDTMFGAKRRLYGLANGVDGRMMIVASIVDQGISHLLLEESVVMVNWGMWEGLAYMSHEQIDCFLSPKGLIVNVLVWKLKNRCSRVPEKRREE